MDEVQKSIHSESILIFYIVGKMALGLVKGKVVPVLN
jgi:hypothetical protein